MVGFEKLKDELAAIGAKVVAISVDPVDKAQEVAAEVSFPIGYGATYAQRATIDAWWEDRRSIIQPAEFIVGEEGKVVVSSYSDGPLGRMDAADVVKLIRFYESRKG